MQPDRLLVERDAERQRLASLVAAVAAGSEGRAVLVEGDAGIGKTRLLVEAADLAGRAGLMVLRAHGTELENDLAYGGARQVLDPVLALPADEVTSLFSGPAALARGVLGLEARTEQPMAEPLHGLYWLVRHLADRRPLAIVVDDLHWLDAESARWVGYLARRIAGVRALLVVARRPDPAGLGLAAEELTTLRLSGLSATGVQTLLEEEAGPAAADYAGECKHVTGGNPFLVLQVAASLAGARAARDPLAFPDPLAVPALGRSVLARAVHVSPVAVDLVRALAVFPAGAEVSDLAELTATPVEDVITAAVRLAAAGILTEEAHLAFRHPLLRSSLYEQLDPHERRRLHLAAATRLTARGVPLEQVAAHLLACEPAGDPGHVRVLETVAEQARARGAPRAAARYLERALAEPPGPGDRWRIAWGCGCLQALVGDDRAEETLRVSLASARSPEERVDSALQLAAVQFAQLRGDDAVETLLPVRSGEELDRERRLLVEGLLAAAAWESTTHVDLYRSVADALPTDLPGDTAGERLALVQAGSRLFDRCRPWREVHAVLSRAIGDGSSPLATPGTDLADPLALIMACGDLAGAKAIAVRREAQARAAGHDAQYAAIQVALARIAFVAGELLEAEAIVDLALELPAVHDFDRHGLWMIRASVAVAKGELDVAEELVAAAESARPGMLGTRVRRARLALARGRATEARDELQSAYDDLLARGSRNPAEMMWTTAYAAALAATGDEPLARATLERLLAAAESFGAPQPLGLLHLQIGTLQGPDGVEHLERAVDLLEPSPYRYDAASTHLALGAWLRRDGHRREAREHLQVALDYARRQGVQPLTERAEAELAASGARLQRRPVTGIDALTPSEQRVCALAARGLSNREIADELFLTTKTIEMHLGRSFRKLGISSRRELAAALDRG